mmetsp:Transcript_7017/g.17421  ORF Transcript_7017/g.17421 Transcript_7017/m.17421 type:complete len:431 (-) Transcript_7017:190-1482(-)
MACDINMENDKGKDGEGHATSNGSPSSQNKRRPVFISNNFENYLKMKNLQKEDINAQDAADPVEWNHFTGPLDPTRQTSSLPARETPKHSTPSVFSDLERSQTVDKFVNVFMERMGDAMSSGKLSQAWRRSSIGDGGGDGVSGSSMFSVLLTDHSPANNDRHQPGRINPDDYDVERKLMEPHFTPMIWGSSCMFLTLISLRFGRWYQGRYVGETLSISSSSSNSKSNHTNSSQRMASIKSLQDVRRAGKNQPYNNMISNSPFNPHKELTDNFKASLNTLPVDMALSTLFGISTTVFLSRPHDLMKDFSSAPLLEGKSALAEELCLPVREEMENVNKMFHTYTPYKNANNEDIPDQRRVVPYSDLWKDENLGEFESLRAIRDFVVNCHERDNVARQASISNAADDAASTQDLMEMKIPPQIISSGDFDTAD